MKLLKFNGIIILVFSVVILSSCRIKNIGIYNRNISSNYDTFKYYYSLVEGEKQFLIGNLNYSKALFNECLKYIPNSSVSYYNLAKIYYQENDLENASRFIDSALFYNNKIVWFYKLAFQINYNLNNFDKTISIVNKIIDLEPNNIQNYINLADLFVQNKKYSEAIKIYNEAESIFGYSEGLSVEKVKIYNITHNNNEAEKELNKLINLYPNNVYYYGLLAEFYIDDVEYEKAFLEYKKILEIDPKNEEVHLSLFYFYLKINNIQDAVNEIDTVINGKNISKEKKIQAIFSINSINDSVVKKKQKKLVDILYNYNQFNYRLGLLKVDYLIKDNEYDSARKILINIVDSVPDNFYVWQQLVFIDNMLNNNINLLSDSKKALELFPNQPIFYLFSGIANYNLKKFNEAISILNIGIDYSNSNKEIKKQLLTYIAEAYFKSGNKDKSYKYFDRALLIDKNDTYILNNYSYYLSIENKDLDKANKMMNLCISFDSTNNSYLDTYAWVLFKSKNFKKSLKYIELAYKYGGNESKVIVSHYGDILYKNGEVEKAVKRWIEAKNLGDNSQIILKKIKEQKYYKND